MENQEKRERSDSPKRNSFDCVAIEMNEYGRQLAGKCLHLIWQRRSKYKWFFVTFFGLLSKSNISRCTHMFFSRRLVFHPPTTFPRNSHELFAKFTVFLLAICNFVNYLFSLDTFFLLSIDKWEMSYLWKQVCFPCLYYECNWLFICCFFEAFSFGVAWYRYVCVFTLQSYQYIFLHCISQPSQATHTNKTMVSNKAHNFASFKMHIIDMPWYDDGWSQAKKIDVFFSILHQQMTILLRLFASLFF